MQVTIKDSTILKTALECVDFTEFLMRFEDLDAENYNSILDKLKEFMENSIQICDQESCYKTRFSDLCQLLKMRMVITNKLCVQEKADLKEIKNRLGSDGLRVDKKTLTDLLEVAKNNNREALKAIDDSIEEIVKKN